LITYSTRELADIKGKIINKINFELDEAFINGNVDDVLKKYGIIYESKSPIMVDTKTMKILVFGALAGKKSEYQKVVKELGIESSHVEFVDEFTDIKNYQVAKLRNSIEYSDILVGPIPHSIKGLKDYDNLISAIKSVPHEYPRLIEMEANNKLKITKTNFLDAIMKTRYIENLYY
jgi:hypothetical protein